MAHGLQDRSIVIIGGTSGIGLSAAIACVEDDARVVAVGLDGESAAAARDRARILVGDAAEAATAERAVDEAVAAFGRLDALYHVAGGSGRRWGDGALHELSEDAIDRTLALNLKSLILSNRAAVRRFLVQGGGGSVLNVGSVLATHPAPHFFSTHVYAAAKSAIIGFTQNCAAHYARENIRFNVIAPGLVDTPMARRAANDPAILAYAASKQPLDGGRIGQPGDLDGAVLFLLGDESRFVTGQVLAVDGGWSVSEGCLPPTPQ